MRAFVMAFGGPFSTSGKSPMHYLTRIGTDMSVDLSGMRTAICAILFSRIAVVHRCYSDRSAVTGFTTAALRDGK